MLYLVPLLEETEEAQHDSYANTIAALRKLFPEQFTSPPTRRRVPTTPGVTPFDEQAGFSSLPWAPQLADCREKDRRQKDDAKVLGQVSKSTGSPGLRPDTYLRHPHFKDSHYRVPDDPWALSAAQVPAKFRALQRSGATAPSVGLSSELEVSFRWLALLLNTCTGSWGRGALSTSDSQKT